MLSTYHYLLEYAAGKLFGQYWASNQAVKKQEILRFWRKTLPSLAPAASVRWDPLVPPTPRLAADARFVATLASVAVPALSAKRIRTQPHPPGTPGPHTWRSDDRAQEVIMRLNVHTTFIRRHVSDI